MAIKCPKCFSENTYVYVTKSKHFNDVIKEFDVSEMPSNIRMMDHVLRRHKCRDCGCTFPTVETYFKKIDVEDYFKNVFDGTKT